MRLIDVQVSFQSLPEHARTHGMEVAGAKYRQMQAIAEARNENLARPERVSQAQQLGASAFPVIDSREEIRKPRSDRFEKSSAEEPMIYSAKGTKQLPVQQVGTKLDLFI